MVMMIKVQSLEKKFDDLEVLKGINLEVKKGEVVVIIGPSGSGKSTLLRCLNYLESPEKGTIDIDGVKIDASKVNARDIQSLRKKSAMVFQSFNLFNHKTVLQNITEALLVVKGMNKDQVVEIGKKLLCQVGLLEKKDIYPSKLSGGQKQRVAIARAMALDPNVILFDEPTSALDPELVNDVLNVIRQLAKKQMTMIIVTHEMSFARDVADRVIFMDDGKIVEEGKPEEVFKSPRHERTKQFLKQIITH